jgi:hypothetical protein
MNLVTVFLAAHIGAFSGRSRGNAYFFKNWAESTIKWAALGFWDAVWGARLGNRRLPYGIRRHPPPQMASKTLAPIAVWGGGGGEWRCSKATMGCMQTPFP